MYQVILHELLCWGWLRAVLWLSTCNTPSKMWDNQNNFCPNKCKLQKFMWTAVLRFPLCTRNFRDGDNSCVSHSALCTRLILVNFLWNKHTTILFPVLAAEKYWSTYRLWGWCSLMIAGDSVRAMLIEKGFFKNVEFCGCFGHHQRTKSWQHCSQLQCFPRKWCSSCQFTSCLSPQLLFCLMRFRVPT